MKKDDLIKRINELKQDADEKTVILYDEIINELNNNKKYGLVWDTEHTKEDVVLKCEKEIPTLVLDESKTIINGGENNLIIEGDNYHSLLALNMIAKESIDVIYIDPPYNTGNEDFVYNDKFINDDDNYKHSKWLSFMEKRLMLCRELMKKKSLVFISIDDREYSQLKLLCDSIFSEKNYITTLKWKKKRQPSYLSNVATIIEYILIYSKDSTLIKKLSVETLSDSDKPIINASNNVGIRRIKKGCIAKCKQEIIKSGVYKNKSMEIEYLNDVVIRNGRTINDFECKAKFRTSQENIDEYCKKDLIFITTNLGLRRDLSEEEKGSPKSITDLLLDWGQNQDGTNELKSVFNLTGTDLPFNNPKPSLLIKNCIKSSMFKNPVVLDFFAGSGTTGQAVLELNKEDGGNRKFILCTNNENNICEEITYQRIKTVITGKRKDNSEYSDGLDGSLYYFKTDFINDENNTDQAKYNLVEKVDSLLCIKEDLYVQKHRNKFSSSYTNTNEDRYMFIYNDYYNEKDFNNFKEMIKNTKRKKTVYIFSTDNIIDETLFDDIDNVEIKPIPSKIYEIYKEIVEDIKRG